VIESGHDPKRFTADLLERLRDLIVVDALGDTSANSILRDVPDDQLERMRTQADRIGTASLSRAADIAAQGLTEMRGATAPRLILELICGRILLPISDATDSGLLARIERLERVENIAPMPISKAAPSVEPVKTSKPVIQEETKKVARVSPEQPTEKKASVSSMEIAGLRRLWPDVIENVKKRRRLTWSLLSASAHILGVDDKNITVGIANAGARDSFVRSESDEILRQAFIEVVGLDRKIEVVVDPSVTPNTPATRAVRVDESPSDVEQLSGAALLARELGAQVIADKK
jgi:DNA polymerase-3 subunit gamma/tau